VICAVPLFEIPLATATAVIVTGVALTATPVTTPLALTVATVMSLVDQVTVAGETVLLLASYGVAVS